MQRSVTVLIAATLAAALTACGGGKQSSSTSTTANASPAVPAAASPAATAAAMKGAMHAPKTMVPMKGHVAMSSAQNIEMGSKVYATNCSSCHQANGKGMTGTFPPLAGNAVVTGPADKVMDIVKNGLSGAITVNGGKFNGQMPAWKSTLSNDDIAAVISYIRNSWGNKASTVTAAQVAAAK
jgi:mono/diheme cytochrome c family protein